MDLRGWVLLILTLGAFIALANGLTRTLALTEADAPEDTFTYHAVWGAWVFGIVMLPVLLVYAEAIRAKWREAILLWLLMGTVAFQKDFSYIRWPGAPLFVTDVVLIGLLMCLIFSGCRVRIRSKPARLLTLYILAGVLVLAWGLIQGHVLLLSIRDFAIVYYSLFAFVGYAIIRDWSAVQRVFLFYLLGAILASIDALGWFLHDASQRRYIGTGVYVLVAFLGVLIFTDRRILKPATGYSLAAVLALGLLLANARSLYVCLAFVIVVMAVAGPRIRRRKTRRIRLKAIMISLMTVAAGALILAQTRAGSAFIDRSEMMLASGTVGFEQDPDALFRLAAWGDALSLFAQHPLAGVGYGVAFQPFDFMVNSTEYGDPTAARVVAISVDTRPHNTYLTVLYQMGVLGIATLAAVLIYYFKAGWRLLRSVGNDSHAVWLYVMLIFQLSMCFYGGLNLMLESPFLASVFWLGIGIGWRIQHLLKLSVLGVQSAAASET